MANPSDISWQDKLSRSMRRADFESAEDLCFEQLLEEPDNVLCLTALGQIAHKRGDLSDAIILYRKATLSSPDHIEPRLLLARALLDNGEISAAGSCLRPSRPPPRRTAHASGGADSCGPPART